MKYRTRGRRFTPRAYILAASLALLFLAAVYFIRP